jgi:hypothetical protein
MEAVNIGVLLFCPNEPFLKVKISRSNDRIRRFFGLESELLARLGDARHALEARFQSEGHRFQSGEDLARFNRSLGGNLLVTEPRPIKVKNPLKELDELFDTLVEVREEGSDTGLKSRSKLPQRLREALNARPQLKGKLLYNQKVEVPITKTVLHAPVAFQNGILNLIAPLSLHHRTMSQARNLALDGDLLRKHRDEMDKPTTLWIALEEAKNDKEQEQQTLALQLFDEYDVPVYTESQLNVLGEMIEQLVH